LPSSSRGATAGSVAVMSFSSSMPELQVSAGGESFRACTPGISQWQFTLISSDTWQRGHSPPEISTGPGD
jgi:hypothetical protein